MGKRIDLLQGTLEDHFAIFRLPVIATQKVGDRPRLIAWNILDSDVSAVDFECALKEQPPRKSLD